MESRHVESQLVSHVQEAYKELMYLLWTHVSIVVVFVE